jgi:BMFP domain-containing protein YqiC
VTLKRAGAIWILVVCTVVAILGVLHAWTLWLAGSTSVITLISFPMDVTTYFLFTFALTAALIGGVCYLGFSHESLELPLFQLSKDLEQKLDAKGEEIKDSTDEALTKLGLREFQLKEGMKAVETKLGKLDVKLQEGLATQKKVSQAARRKLAALERKINKIQTTQKDLPTFKRQLEVVGTMEKDLKTIQGRIERIDSIPEPHLSSTDDLRVLEGKVLKRETVQQLKQNGVTKIADVLLKSPVEIAMTKTMSESEAQNLQSVIQMMMIPGIQHDEAVLLLKSGVNSKQELALQDTVSLVSRVARTADLYIDEGKIQETQKPSFEDVASWIRWAKTA